MFNQRKRFFQKRWFLLTVILLIGVGYWINQSSNPTDSLEPPNRPTDSVQPLDPDKSDEPSGTTDTTGTPTESAIVDNQSPYFLVKVENGIISIFFCKEDGTQTFVRQTDIAYSMLSQVDQALFRQGVTAKSEAELEELLQDFGS